MRAVTLGNDCKGIIKRGSGNPKKPGPIIQCSPKKTPQGSKQEREKAAPTSKLTGLRLGTQPYGRGWLTSDAGGDGKKERKALRERGNLGKRKFGPCAGGSIRYTKEQLNEKGPAAGRKGPPFRRNP